MVIIMTMIQVNIHEAKARLSEYLEAVARGERVVICKRNRPIAELRALARKRTDRRPIGLAKGQVTIPPSFFKPMPDEWLDEFYNGPVFPEETAPTRVPPSSRKRKRSR
jgi:antitoxin (DNA-binding transcriptional repressor) of toxin-antitoxin stability system